jgi:hypothetical protein
LLKEKLSSQDKKWNIIFPLTNIGLHYKIQKHYLVSYLVFFSTIKIFGWNCDLASEVVSILRLSNVGTNITNYNTVK